MKYIVIKIFNSDNHYLLKLQYLKYNDINRLIYGEIVRDFTSLKEVQMFLSNYTYNNDYKNAPFLINYISNDVIIENIKIEKNKPNINKIKQQINEFYPNFETNYQFYLMNYSLSNQRKFISVKLYQKAIIKMLNEVFNNLNRRKVYYNLDSIMLDNYISRIKFNNLSKHVVFIQIENGFWRFSEIINNRLIKYLLIDQSDIYFEKELNMIFHNLDRRIDEIIVDSDYKTYTKLCDDWSSYNVLYIDYVDKLRYLDERKLVYASK